MTDDRLITAIGRLERALSRIEAKGASLSGQRGDPGEREPGLKERHLRLRSRTQSAIERLDRLLGPADDGVRHNGHGAESRR